MQTADLQQNLWQIARMPLNSRVYLTS